VFCTVLREQGRKDGQGDLCEPIERGLLSWEKIVDLGPVLAGISPGRRSDDEITVFKQNSDQGVGFMALARLAHDKAKIAGVGLQL
jgi:ornithine cyclodeaminase/alanine dehydrogenase-like protein (mu-crystallin family)